MMIYLLKLEMFIDVTVRSHRGCFASLPGITPLGASPGRVWAASDQNSLVVWNMAFMTFHILGIIIPTILGIISPTEKYIGNNKPN